MSATEKCPRLQALMNQAYDRWQKNEDWSKQAFWDQLDAMERVAVFAGNMHYQVCNGGFQQWVGNKYATEETLGFLLQLTDRVGTEAAGKVAALIRAFVAAVEKYGEEPESEEDDEEFMSVLDVLDTQYYDGVGEQWMADLEAWVVAQEKQS